MQWVEGATINKSTNSISEECYLSRLRNLGCHSLAFHPRFNNVRCPMHGAGSRMAIAVIIKTCKKTMAEI
jgi:hypothetical protein